MKKADGPCMSLTSTLFDLPSHHLAKLGKQSSVSMYLIVSLCSLYKRTDTAIIATEIGLSFCFTVLVQLCKEAGCKPAVQTTDTLQRAIVECFPVHWVSGHCNIQCACKNNNDARPGVLDGATGQHTSYLPCILYCCTSKHAQLHM